MKNIYFKITTIPVTEDNNSREFEIWADKYSEVKELKGYDETFKAFLQEAGKSPSFARIFSLTVGYVEPETNQIRITVFKGSERNILQSFFNLYQNEYFKGAQSVYWNGEFILSFISTRALANGIKVSSIPTDLRHFGLKSWNMKSLDIQSYVKGASWHIPNLEELANVLSIPTDFVNHTDIYNLIKSGQEESVDESSISEVATLVNIHRVLQDLDKIDDIVSTVTVVEQEVQEKEIPLLEKLYNTKNFTAVKEDLEKLLKKKKPTKKDKEGIFTILRGVYVQTDFINSSQDSKKVIEQKEKEINEFLNTL